LISKAITALRPKLAWCYVLVEFLYNFVNKRRISK